MQRILGNSVLGRLNEIYRYPVKSMMGERLTDAQLEGNGIPGDRAWAVRDEERGGIRGAKRFPELMRCSARYETDPPLSGSAPAHVVLPDGEQLAINDEQMASRLSELVAAPVSVWPLLPADELQHYRRGAPLLEDFEAEMRRVFARTPDQPLPDLGAFPEELMQYESPPGTYFDAFPLLIMTRQSLDYLSAVSNRHNLDVRRFRPNLLIDTGEDGGFPERDWLGRTLTIGDAEVAITMECPRCVMTTHAFDTLPKDPAIMSTLVQHADGNLGVYARVTRAAAVNVGDPIEFA